MPKLTMCRLCHAETETGNHQVAGREYRVPVCVKCGCCKCADCVKMAEEASAKAKAQS